MKKAAELLTFGVNGQILPWEFFRGVYDRIYPHFDCIFIAEGASKALPGDRYEGDPTLFARKSDFSSCDGSRDKLGSLPDPDKKLYLAFNHPAAPWPGKTAMCNALLDRAKDKGCEIMWHFDADEVYTPETFQKVFDLFEKPENRNCDLAVEFFCDYYIGRFNQIVNDPSPMGFGNDIPWRRVFRIFPNSVWDSHEPPRLRRGDRIHRVIPREETLAMGLKLHHYGLVFKSQAEFKDAYWPGQGGAYVHGWKNSQKAISGPFNCPLKTVPYGPMGREYEQ